MHSALLVIDKPDFEEPGKPEALMEVLRIVSAIEKNDKGIEILGAGVVLVALSTSFSMLCTLVAAIQTKQLSYRVLFLEKEPQWMR